jgi:hypothetical protein
LLVSLTNLSVNRSLTRWRAGGLRVSVPELTDADNASEAMRGSRLGYLLSAACKASGASLRDYQKQMQRVLDEVQESETANPPDSRNGRSRLLSIPPNSGLFS